MKKITGLICLMIAMNVPAFADGYWLELKGSGQPGDTLEIRIRYGGVDEQKNRYIKKGHDLDKMKDFALFVLDKNGNTQKVPIAQHPEFWSGYYIPKEKATYRILARNESLPVVERPDSMQNIKPIQYLCTTYRVAGDDIAKSPAQDLDIQIDGAGSSIQITPFLRQHPVASTARLRIFYPDNHDEQLTVDDTGKAILPVTAKGIYLLRFDWIDNHEGVYQRKKYFSTRHRCDYSYICP